MTAINAQQAARHLLQARSGSAVASQLVLPADRAGAYAIQDATLAQLGPIAGWTVGAMGPQAEPTFAPLPAAGLLAGPAVLAGPPWQLRGIELEVAFRLGRDLDPGDALLAPADLIAAIDSVLPAIEVVETRLADWRGADPLAQLADLQSHGALVLGTPSTLRPDTVDLRTVQARLRFNGQEVANTHGGNPAADVWRMLAWLARHCALRGQPLRAGQVLTTGSCTGMLFAPALAQVQGQLEGIGRVELHF